MNRTEQNAINLAEVHTATTPDDLNPAFVLRGVDTKILAAVIAGEIDLNELANKEMANRGLNARGEWVGFDRAVELRDARTRRRTRRMASGPRTTTDRRGDAW